MVESSGDGGCRCACQEEFEGRDDAAEGSAGCCSPQVFTSVLLGILSCVLMTGGVFLAFHRWDPMWLIVSGVGVVLILIGTILHCCSNSDSQPRRQSTGGKGCCTRPAPPEHHHGHMVPNNGSLTEQLLPLSNARSVSQLSLNMLPGYFPPVVTAYGIEQHSAVVQNINRLVQQQQQQQQQQQTQQQQQPSPGSASPGVVSGAGKSFILLSLPGDATSANIQNLVATVYQIDGNATGETQAAVSTSIMPAQVACAKPIFTTPLALKNAEVQTCNVWSGAGPVPNSVPLIGDSASPLPASSSAAETSGRNSIPVSERSTTAMTTQTDDSVLSVIAPINLMDCSSDISPVCDNVPSSCDRNSAEHLAFVNIPEPSSTVLVDVSEPPTVADVTTEAPSTASQSVLVDIPDAVPNSGENIPSGIAMSINAQSQSVSEVLVDISVDDSTNNTNFLTSVPEIISDSNLPPSTTEVNNNAHCATVVQTGTSLELLENAVSELPTSSLVLGVNSELSESMSNLSAIDAEVDDGEFLDRSSPPPSYDDVTHEGDNPVGAFGLAYGTI